MGKKASTLLIAEIESKNNQQKEVKNYIHIVKSPLIKEKVLILSNHSKVN